MKVTIKVYDQCKYNRDSKEVGESTYDIINYRIAYKADEEIYDEGFDTVDPYHEYLILEHDDGTTSTFRNSFVDMFGE